GLTLMGARLYNPTTGRFQSTDPVHGGNANTYTYPVNPITMYDLNGQWGFSDLWSGIQSVGSWAWDNRGTIATVVAVAGCFGGPALCAGAMAGAYAVRATQRIADVGWSDSWQTNLADGIVSGMTFGVGSAFRAAAPRMVTWSGKAMLSRPRVNLSRQSAYTLAYRGASMGPYYGINHHWNRNRSRW
ncbi:MAG: hypothetical protein EPO13_00460, partial [Actinomycetota bacterium]